MNIFFFVYACSLIHAPRKSFDILALNKSDYHYIIIIHSWNDTEIISFKPVKIWQICSQNITGTFLWITVYILLDEYLPLLSVARAADPGENHSASSEPPSLVIVVEVVA